MIKNGDLISGKFGSTQWAGFWPVCYLMARLKVFEVKWSNCCISETVRARAVKFLHRQMYQKVFIPQKKCAEGQRLGSYLR